MRPEPLEDKTEDEDDDPGADEPRTQRVVPGAEADDAAGQQDDPERPRRRGPDRAAVTSSGDRQITPSRSCRDEGDRARQRGRDERRPHRSIRPEQRQQDRSGRRGCAVRRVGDPDRSRPRDPVVRLGHSGQRDRQRDARRSETDHPADHEERTIGHEQADDRGHEHRREGTEEQPASAVRITEDAADQEQTATDDRRQEQQDLGLTVLPDRGLDRAETRRKDPRVQTGGEQRQACDPESPDRARLESRSRRKLGIDGRATAPDATRRDEPRVGSARVRRGYRSRPSRVVRGLTAVRRRGSNRGRPGPRRGRRRAP